MDPEQISCGKCAKLPALRELNGCNGPSKNPFTFPDMSVDRPIEYKRVTVNTCPVNVVTDDVWDLLSTYQRAKSITISESELLPPPYLEAWDLIMAEHATAKSHQVSKAMKGN
jgi:hypothetical protein